LPKGYQITVITWGDPIEAPGDAWAEASLYRSMGKDRHQVTEGADCAEKAREIGERWAAELEG
jgi:hypothetical protein